MTLGERIKKLRLDLDLTQNQLGEKIGIHGRQLCRYEKGVTIPSLEILAKLANYCEVSLDYLFFGKDPLIAKRSKISDQELLDLLRRIDRLKRTERDKIKWIIRAALNNK